MRSSSVPLALLLLWGELSRVSADKVDQSDSFFTNHVIPRLQIQLGDEALAALRNQFRTYVKCMVLEGTNVYSDVGIHLKGQYGTFQGAALNNLGVNTRIS